MAKCIECGDEFVPTRVQMTCPECLDMQDDATQEIIDYVDDDVDEIQENEDFAHDDDFYNREMEDQWIDAEYESRTEYDGGDY